MRVLVIQTAFIGDVVLTTPLLAALQKQWPAVEIHFVATKQGAEVLVGLKGVHTHVLDKRGTGFRKGIRNVLLALNSEGKRYELVLCVHRSLRSLWIGSQVASARKIAFNSFWARALGYETVEYPPYDDNTHYVDKPLTLLAKINPHIEVPHSPAPETRPVLAVTPAEEIAIRAKLPFSGRESRYIVVSPFSVWGTKMWFADRFAGTAAELARRTKLPIVIAGSGGGREQAIGTTTEEKIRRAGGEAVSLVGKTTLGELKALVARSSLVIANDSAPIHFASAFNIPTVAIFGPTVRKWGFFPLSTQSVVVERPTTEVPCRPCHIHGPQKCPKGHFRCMSEIKVEDVLAAVEKLNVDGVSNQ